MKNLEMHDLLQFLRETPFFAELDAKYIEHIAEHHTVREVKAGEVFLKYGEEAEFFNLIYKGEVSLGVMNDDELVTISELTRKDYIGWSAIVPPHTWSFDAKAKTDLVLICLDGLVLRQMCKDDFSFGAQMMTCTAMAITDRLTAARVALIESVAE